MVDGWSVGVCLRADPDVAVGRGSKWRGVGHSVYLKNPSQFNSALDGFFAEPTG